MSFLSQIDLQIKSNLYQNLSRHFVETDKSIPKFILKYRESRQPKQFWEKKKKGQSQEDLYHMSSRFKDVGFKIVKQFNRTKQRLQEQDYTYICGQLFFNKGTRQFSEESMVSFLFLTNGAGTMGYLYTKYELHISHHIKK